MIKEDPIINEKDMYNIYPKIKVIGRAKDITNLQVGALTVLYKTTSEFLDYFGLSDISDLPKITPKSESENNDIDLYKSKYEEEIIE